MEITLIPSVEEAVNAKWLTVIIDVFRAFSTECYMFDRGATRILLAQTLYEAYALKNEHPEYILAGERGGLKPEWFDFGNSPTEIVEHDFTGKTIVHTTSNGTKGMLLATQATELLTGSFVNAGAIIRYIKQTQPEYVSLVSTSPSKDEAANEDLMLAYYLRDCLEGKTVSELQIRDMLTKTSAYQYLFNEIGVPATDFDLCLDFNRFNFVIRQEMIDGKNVLVRVDM